MLLLVGVLISLQSFHRGILRDSDNKHTVLITFNRKNAYPRTTGCFIVHKAFFTIKKTREYIIKKGVPQYKKVFKDTAQDTTPKKNSITFYAIAHKKHSSIRQI